jgi:aminoglycoside/choline kinase family phosphotransferase
MYDNSPTDPTVDARVAALNAWLARELGTHGFALAPASADASFRRYFRVTLEAPAAIANGAPTLIAMDAPPEKEDCRPFVRIATLLIDAGLNAPSVLAQDLANGFLLLRDLGTVTYLNELVDPALSPARASELFRDAIDALILWQRATREGILPPYDEALIRRELALFPDWYLGRHLALELSRNEQAELARIFDVLVRTFAAQAQVYTHRDYMPRNLMVSDPNPGVLDFQDAVIGPIAYDVISLYKDAFVSWPEERVQDGCIRYWEKARRAGLPVPADFTDFYRALDFTGLQRHLKVLGIFARIRYRDGKSGYLEDTPRFLGYARVVAERYSELRALARLIDRIEERVPQVGYTF